MARFLVFEGMDGTGKTTQARRLVERLRAAGGDPLHLREPGTTALGERLRALLLEPAREDWDPLAEALLFFAARVELLRREVQPALAAGRDVVCERFTPSTLAYQGQDPADAEAILALDRLLVPPELQPRLVVLLDLPAEEAWARAGGGAAQRDGIEGRGVDFQERVRAGYRRYARARPEATLLVDAAGRSAEEIGAEVDAALAAGGPA